MVSTLALSALLLSVAGQVTPPSVPVMPFPSGEVQTVNIIQWDANALPKLYQRSDQLPLTDTEIIKLSKAGFDTAQLVKMIEERRCACDVSASGLIQLKQQGVAKEILTAVSTHGLKPNRELNLLVTLDFSGQSQTARESFLYFFVDDGDLTRVFTANLDELLSKQHAHEELVDKSDLLRTRRVRRIQLAGELPLKSYGRHAVLVAASGNPSLTHPTQLTPQERAAAQTYAFDYPRASLQSLCRITAGYRRDPVLVHKWRFMGSRFECEWD
jgi:hypothetical protein